jgi:C4-dicarboxylate-specific signal transduction histidine kinase
MQGSDIPETPLPLSQLVHDLNQPLSAISTYAHAGKHLLDNGHTDPARLKELFAKIATQSTRATVLSHELGKAIKAMSPGPEAT